jgi:hypothetical protein
MTYVFKNVRFNPMDRVIGCNHSQVNYRPARQVKIALWDTPEYQKLDAIQSAIFEKLRSILYALYSTCQYRE